MYDRQRIMVVDDDQDMMKLLNRTLELEGFEAIAVTDGESALNLLEKVSPDLVILDIVLPGLDGLQTLDLIRKHSDVPVIMLTARHEATIMQRALFLGADDYISKPFSTRSLIARIRAEAFPPKSPATIEQKTAGASVPGYRKLDKQRTQSGR
jgi:DNA-binding response OmpR family regulator